MWIILYGNISFEVTTLISILKGDDNYLPLLTNTWSNLIKKCTEYKDIELENENELDQVMKNTKDIKIKHLPVVLEVDKQHAVKKIYYMKDIFNDDEFNIVNVLESMNKAF